MEDLTASSSGPSERVGLQESLRDGGRRGARSEAGTWGMWPSSWNSLSLFSYDKLHMSYKDQFSF